MTSTNKYIVDGPLVLLVATAQDCRALLSSVDHVKGKSFSNIPKSNDDSVYGCDDVLFYRHLEFKDLTSDSEPFGLCQLVLGDNIRTFYAFLLNPWYEVDDRALLDDLHKKYGTNFIELGQHYMSDIVGVCFEKLADILKLTTDEISNLSINL